MAEVEKAGIHGDSFYGLITKMAGHLVNSRSENTVKKYFHYFQKWERFVTSKGGQSLPASPILICLYLTELLDKKCSANVISCTVYSIKWAHSLRNLSDPTENLFVKNLLESAKRIPRKPVQKKDPISTQMLIDLCDKYQVTTDVLIVRDLCMILLGYSAFLRYDELRNLHCSDVKFNDDYFTLRIRKSKTDQYRFGNDIVVSKGCTSACPLEMLKRYFNLSSQTTESNHFLFRPCFSSKGKTALIYKDKPLSYTRTKESIVSRLNEVAENLNLGLHSLRSGGATCAANAGVNDRCWKRHGRWRSDASKDGYIADSLENRLTVTKHLHL